MRFLAALIAAALLALSPAKADFQFLQGVGTTSVGFDSVNGGGTNRCAATNAVCFGFVPMDRAGTQLLTNTNPAYVIFPTAQSVIDNLTQIGGTNVVTGGQAGALGVGGLAATGTPLTGNPLLVGGSDGTNARSLSTDASGHLIVEPGNTANTTAWLVTGAGGTFPVTQSGLWTVNQGGTWSVGIAAGSNTIGAISNTTFGATESGTWNITNITGTISLPTGAAISGNQPTNAAQGSTTSGQTGNLGMCAVTTSAPSYTNAQSNLVSCDTAGNQRVTGAGGTFPATQSGTWTVNQGGTWNVGLSAGTNAIGSITNTSFAATQSGTWNITNISGTVSLPTGASTAALQPTNAAQGSTTSGQTGHLTLAAVTTASPTYTTAQTSPLSMDTAGSLRVNCITGCSGSGIAANVSVNGWAAGTIGTGTLQAFGASQGTIGSGLVPAVNAYMVNASADPCTGAKSTADFSSASSGGSIVAGSASKITYVCSVDIVTSAAANISLVEGTGSAVCTGGTPAAVYFNTGTTAGNGAAFAANGGIAKGDGTGTVAKTAVTADNLCVLFTTTNTPTVNVHVAYVQQ